MPRHVMAEAVQDLWPGTQVTIGPVIENGFFYDFGKQQPFEPEDIPKIERRMGGDHRRERAVHEGNSGAREKAKQFFRDKGEVCKIELVDAIPAGEDLKIYKQGEWLDLCRGPHMTSTGQIGASVQADEVRRRLLARRQQQPAAAAHLRHGVRDGGRAQGRT